jgi:hypothetical protein
MNNTRREAMKKDERAKQTADSKAKATIKGRKPSGKKRDRDFWELEGRDPSPEEQEVMEVCTASFEAGFEAGRRSKAK